MKNERIIFTDSFLTVEDRSRSEEEQRLSFFQTDEQRRNFKIPDEVLAAFNLNPGFVVTYAQYLRGIDIIPEEQRRTCWEKIITDMRRHPRLPSYFNNAKVRWEKRDSYDLKAISHYSVETFFEMAAA